MVDHFWAKIDIIVEMPEGCDLEYFEEMLKRR
jgi:hypothetical protein